MLEEAIQATKETTLPDLQKQDIIEAVQKLKADIYERFELNKPVAEMDDDSADQPVPQERPEMTEGGESKDYQ